jgi:hypothetical protein
MFAAFFTIERKVNKPFPVFLAFGYNDNHGVFPVCVILCFDFQTIQKLYCLLILAFEKGQKKTQVKLICV